MGSEAGGAFVYRGPCGTCGQLVWQCHACNAGNCWACSKVCWACGARLRGDYVSLWGPQYLPKSDEALSKDDLLAKLEAFRAVLRREGRDDAEDAVLEVMDQVEGHCSPALKVRRMG